MRESFYVNDKPEIGLEKCIASEQMKADHQLKWNFVIIRSKTSVNY